MPNTPGLLGASGVAGFMGLYISRRFGIGLAGVGALLAPPLLISGLAGNTAGGWLVDWRSRVGDSYRQGPAADWRAAAEVPAAGAADALLETWPDGDGAQLDLEQALRPERDGYPWSPRQGGEKPPDSPAGTRSGANWRSACKRIPAMPAPSSISPGSRV